MSLLLVSFLKPIPSLTHPETSLPPLTLIQYSILQIELPLYYQYDWRVCYGKVWELMECINKKHDLWNQAWLQIFTVTLSCFVTSNNLLKLSLCFLVSKMGVKPISCVEKGELSYTVGENASSTATLENSMQVLQKVKNRAIR